MNSRIQGVLWRARTVLFACVGLLAIPALSQTATTTALTPSVNPSTYGSNITLTASVTGSGGPTGNVTFKDGTTTLGTRALQSGVAKLGTAALLPGTHSLTAIYNGDTNNTTSTSSALSQLVNKAVSSVSLSASQATVTLGQNVTLSASVGGLGPTGIVTFVDGSTTLGTTTLSGGVASYSTMGLAQGLHNGLGATYAGDANNASSSASAVSVNVVPRAGMVWQYGYDAMGRINTQVDPNGQATYFYYDGLGRRIQTQQPPAISGPPTLVSYGWDAMDSLTSVLDPRSITTTYTVTGVLTATGLSSPDSGSSNYTYDAKGNVLTKTDARGKVSTYSYDAIDRLTGISYTTGTATTFEYDGGASPTPAAAGSLTKMTDESGQTVYTFDAMGRMTGKTVTIAGKSFTVGYTWGDSGTALDKLTSVTYPTGNRVNYSYDTKGFVSAISLNAVNTNGVGVNATARTLLNTATYNADNNITGWLWSDGKARPIGYESNGLINTYTLGDPNATVNPLGVLRTIGRDAAGRITSYTHTNNGNTINTLTQTFGYDNLDRLTAYTQSTTTIGWGYDATGNRTTQTTGGVTYTNTVAATSNRYTQVQDPLGTGTIGHDAAGNITSDGTYTFTYSDRGRMASAITATGTVAYLYNGLDQRAKKSGPGTLVPTGAAHFVYDEAGQLLGEYDATGNPLYETIYLGSTPVGVLKQTGTGAANNIAVTIYNEYADHVDTPRVITRQDHVIVWRWSLAEPFGTSAASQNPSGVGVFVYNQRFPGQVFDSETGLFQNWNREYNARLGRYIESDPIGLAGGINTFSYAQGSPTMLSDSSGLDTTVVCRPVNVRGVGWIAKHCFIVVWHWEIKDCTRVKVVDGQYSLAGNRKMYDQDSPADTYQDDKRAWNGRSPADFYPIPPPPGMSSGDFDKEVRRQAMDYDSGRPYDATAGPNSNTATYQTVQRAGGGMPFVFGAWGQYWTPPGPLSPPQPLPR